MTANTKASNNMSDEEMEDVISELENVGVHSYCHQEMFWHNKSNYRVDWSKSTLSPGENCMESIR